MMIYRGALRVDIMSFLISGNEHPRSAGSTVDETIELRVIDILCNIIPRTHALRMPPQ